MQPGWLLTCKANELGVITKVAEDRVLNTAAVERMAAQELPICTSEVRQPPTTQALRTALLLIGNGHAATQVPETNGHWAAVEFNIKVPAGHIGIRALPAQAAAGKPPTELGEKN